MLLLLQLGMGLLDALLLAFWESETELRLFGPLRRDVQYICRSSIDSFCSMLVVQHRCQKSDVVR